MSIETHHEARPSDPAVSHLRAIDAPHGIHENQATAHRDEMARMEALRTSTLRAPR